MWGGRNNRKFGLRFRPWGTYEMRRVAPQTQKQRPPRRLHRAKSKRKGDCSGSSDRDKLQDAKVEAGRPHKATLFKMFSLGRARYHPFPGSSPSIKCLDVWTSTAFFLRMESLGSLAANDQRRLTFHAPVPLHQRLSARLGKVGSAGDTGRGKERKRTGTCSKLHADMLSFRNVLGRNTTDKREQNGAAGRRGARTTDSPASAGAC